MIDETVEEIEDMQTHSSSIVAVKAASALRDVLDRDVATVEEFERDLERNASALRRANPSHATLQNAMVQIVHAVTETDHDSVEDAKAVARSTIERVVDGIERSKRRAANHASSLLDDGGTILTHDFSSTVLEAVERAAHDDRALTVYVTEARPRFFGRKTARAMASYDNVDAHIITDGACGHYLRECDRVMIGMTCIVDETLYNRIGTFPLAATANEVDTPMTVVGSGAKIVGDAFVFENEYRPASEVMREPAVGFRVENPAYDATPLDLIDSVVTDGGEQDV